MTAEVAGQLALNKAYVTFDNYYASEIKKHAITSWQLGSLNDFMFKTKSSDSYVFFNIGLYDFGSGDLFIDNLELYEY